jgi:hypothetical protein
LILRRTATVLFPASASPAVPLSVTQEISPMLLTCVSTCRARRCSADSHALVCQGSLERRVSSCVPTRLREPAWCVAVGNHSSIRRPETHLQTGLTRMNAVYKGFLLDFSSDFS